MTPILILGGAADGYWGDGDLEQLIFPFSFHFNGTLNDPRCWFPLRYERQSVILQIGEGTKHFRVFTPFDQEFAVSLECVRKSLKLAIRRAWPKWREANPLILADWLEEQGDGRCELLRAVFNSPGTD
jgi:hypothetical protein